jgi:hypothetical protein
MCFFVGGSYVSEEYAAAIFRARKFIHFFNLKIEAAGSSAALVHLYGTA